MLPMLATTALEKALNQCLRLDPETLADVIALEGRVIAFEVQGLGIELFLVPTAEGLRLQTIFEGQADVRVKGGLFGLARMGLSERPASVFGDGVEIEGDTHLARQIQRILDSLDIDWEEQLSRFSGDIVAHQLGNIVRGAVSWGRNSVGIFGRDVVEYLQEESRDLVVKEEVTPFYDEVDALRANADRFEQGLQLLLKKVEKEKVAP